MAVSHHLPSSVHLWNRRSVVGHQLPQKLLAPNPKCELSKQGHRFLSKLAISSAATDDPSSIHRLLSKFVASSPKHVSLNTLSHLLSSTTSSTHPHLSNLAFPLYSIITEASWFRWNSKLVAQVTALLYKQGRLIEAFTLISETVSKLGFPEREICCFYCYLMDFHSKHQSKEGVLDTRDRFKKLLSTSSTLYVKQQAYEAMINGLCVVALPDDAEILMEEMKGLGLRPSAFQFRSVIYAYGRLGLFEEMRRSALQMETHGFVLDTVCSNMVLSSFGAHNSHLEMVSWIRKMKGSNVPLSTRTYNSVLNTCPEIMSKVQNPRSVPLSIGELVGNLCEGEALLIQELIQSSVLKEAMEWNSLQLKLDLHGMHVGSAYLIMLQWFEELRSRFLAEDDVLPVDIILICGSGKHSSVRGESPVKGLIKEMMIRLNCPMRLDRKNIGCFIAKGRVMRNWFCK